MVVNQTQINNPPNAVMRTKPTIIFSYKEINDVKSATE